MPRTAPLLLLGALAALTSACASVADTALPSELLHRQPLDPRVHAEIWPGDVIEVRHRNTPELDAIVTVRPDGGIQVPLAGEMEAAGRLPTELEELIEERCRAEVRKPDVAVIVTEYAGRTALVGGEVNEPGPVLLNRPTTLLEALMAAGGFLPTAATRTVVLLRRYEASDIGGEEWRSYVVDASKILGGDPDAHNLRLQPTDVVFVPRSGVADVNVWIDQYIRQNIPVNLAFRPDIGPQR